MSLTQFHEFRKLPTYIRKMIWEFASVQAHDGPRLYHFRYEFETRQEAEMQRPSGLWYTDVSRGPILSFRPQLAEETKNQRAILMTCRDARQTFLSLYPDRINFTRPRHLGEYYCEYPKLSNQYPLFINAQVDVLCLSGEELQHKCHPKFEPYFQVWARNASAPSLNWPLWKDFKNIAIDVTNPDATLDEKGDGMKLDLFFAARKIIFNTSQLYETRLFAANFGPIQHDTSGRPLHMTVDKAIPEYKSTMPGPLALPQGTPGLSVEHMCLMLDDMAVIPPPRWGGRYRSIQCRSPSRLLVRSADGQRLLAVKHVDSPRDKDYLAN